MKVRAFVMGLVLLSIVFAQNVQADDEISHPSRIPFFDGFSSPTIKPGESGTFTMSMKNRYEMAMENVSITIALYASATYNEYTDIRDVENPPSIGGSGIDHTVSFSQVAANETIYSNFTIKSNPDTTQGTYFVRFQLDFDYNKTAYVMKSRGHFSDSLWDEATSSVNDTNVPDDSELGEIDLKVLGVDGIIPDTSFKVWDPIPIWPLYVCVIPLIVLLGVLAMMFYAQDEYNMFPWLDQGFKYWSGKLHQSWRLLKHRFRKA